MLLAAYTTLGDIEAASEIHECPLRMAGLYGTFPEVESLLARERMQRQIRKREAIVDILGGDWFLKIAKLNASCYVLKFPTGHVDVDGEQRKPRIIEGWKQCESPPLSAPASAKPSVSKS